MKEKSNKKESKIDLKKNFEYVAKIRSALKNNDIAKDICKENGYDSLILDGIAISFDRDIDVKAKTRNGEILLNQDLIDTDISKLMTYIIHELTHVFQHIERIGKKDPHEGEDYLDRPDEIEAFRNQIEQDSKTRPISKIKKYVEDLVSYHKVPDKEKDEKVEELMENINS